MKTLRFFGMMLMAVVLSFGMTACGDDDNDGDSGIYTTWYTIDEDGDYEFFTFTSSSLTVTYVWESAGQYYKESETIPCVIKGNEIIVTDEGESASVTYSIKGNTLTLSTGKQIVATYTKADSKTLSILNNAKKYSSNLNASKRVAIK